MAAVERREDGDTERRHVRLVDELVGAGAIRHPRIEAAFRAVRRHWFLPGVPIEDVYRDQAVVTHRAEDGLAVSSSSQPALMAEMLSQLAVEADMTVLEVGTGTGYNAALLAQLVGPAGTVVSVDIDPTVTGPAGRHLVAAGAANVEVVTGDAWELETGARFDRIEATVGLWDLPPAWVEHLKPGGVLVAPLWLRAGQQVSIAFRHVDGVLESISVHPCGFMRMRGPGAGEAAYRQVGSWTVSADGDDPERLEALTGLLNGDGGAEPLPTLPQGWFTAIALGEPDAVHMFSHAPAGPVIRLGILQEAPAGLAVVETRPPRANVIRAVGSDDARQRLLELLERTPAIDPRQLAISAVPAGADVDDEGALATLARPNFTFVVKGPPDGSTVRDD